MSINCGEDRCDKEAIDLLRLSSRRAYFTELFIRPFQKGTLFLVDKNIFCLEKVFLKYDH